ncbi:MAG: transposase [Akkermansia sp.]|nr:transposase [Akkermansia sp.]
MPPGRSIIVADRGYDDTQLWRDWDSRGISFVVRLRKDIKFIRKEAFPQPDDREQDILVDEAVELVGDEMSKNYPHPLPVLWFTARMILPAAKRGRLQTIQKRQNIQLSLSRIMLTGRLVLLVRSTSPAGRLKAFLRL